MKGPAIEYNESHAEIEDILRSVDRSGDYFAQGRIDALPPRMHVGEVGRVAFPILDFQIRSLVEVAEQAPYGRGSETLVDTAVRDCWQIDAAELELGGPRWGRTLGSILKRVAEGLGLPKGRVDLEPYKLLIYEPGGFFADHRDTEKADRMVATLVVSLPVDGEGGELVIRHQDRETTIDLCVDEPGELAFAAFYADCLHHTRPVRRGHRASLVYNVIVKPGKSGVRATAPDTALHAQKLARILSGLGQDRKAPRKIVWMLEHEYSEAGLCLEALKGLDASTTKALAGGAEAADCDIFLAILRIQEYGTPDCDYGWDYGEKYIEDPSASMREVHDGSYTLCNWVAIGRNPTSDLPELPLEDGETLPRGYLDNAEPDKQHIEEATGNGGASLERSYRRAAVVIWPRANSVEVLANGDIGAAVRYVSRELSASGEEPGAGEARSLLLGQLLDAWPTASPGYYPDQFMQRRGNSVGEALGLLLSVKDRALASRFVENVVPRQFHGELNEQIVSLMETLDASGLAPVLSQIVQVNAKRQLGAVLDLLSRLADSRHAESGESWQRLVRARAESALRAVPEILLPPDAATGRYRYGSARALNAREVRDILLACRRFDLDWQAAEVAQRIVECPDLVDPYRTLPEAIAGISARSDSASATASMTRLWGASATNLLERSARLPPGREDKSIEAPARREDQEHRQLAAFCRDPSATVIRFQAAEATRSRIEGTIRSEKLDVRCTTERRGRPYTLVCTKDSAKGYAKRIDRYRADIRAMARLEEAAHILDSAESAELLGQLRAAIKRSAQLQGPRTG